jgi:hypothetical protein
VNVSQIRGVVHPGASLDNVLGEESIELVGSKVLSTGDAGDLGKLQLESASGERSERKVGLLVKLQERLDDLLHKVAGVVRRRAVLPEQLGQIPPLPGSIVLLVDELLPIPDT